MTRYLARVDLAYFRAYLQWLTVFKTAQIQTRATSAFINVPQPDPRCNDAARAAIAPNLELGHSNVHLVLASNVTARWVWTAGLTTLWFLVRPKV